MDYVTEWVTQRELDVTLHMDADRWAPSDYSPATPDVKRFTSPPYVHPHLAARFFVAPDGRGVIFDPSRRRTRS